MVRAAGGTYRPLASGANTAAVAPDAPPTDNSRGRPTGAFDEPASRTTSVRVSVGLGVPGM